MGKVVETVQEYTDLSSLVNALKSSSNSVLSMLSDIKTLIAGNPFLTAASGKYHYILGTVSLATITPNQIVETVNRNGSGFLFTAVVVSYGSPNIEVTVSTSTKGYLNTFSETLEDLFKGGFANSSLFKVLQYDPVGQTYSMESIPNNFYVWYDDYAKIELTSQEAYPFLYSYRYVLAELAGSV